MLRARVLLAVIVVMVLAGFVGGVLAFPGAAGSPRARLFAQKKEEEEDEPKKKPKGKEEEEEGAKPPPRKIEQPEDVKKPSQPTSVVETPDLPTAYRNEKHSAVKALYESLLVPADQFWLSPGAKVTVNGNAPRGGKVLVEPVPTYWAAVKDMKAQFPVVVIDETGKKIQDDKLPPGWIKEFRYYEELAVKAVTDFLDSKLDRLDKQNARYLIRYDQYVAAEVALSAVLRFHRSARERKVRQGEGWTAVEDEVRKHLLEVLLARLDLLTAAKSWDQSFELMRHVIDTFRRPAETKVLATHVSKFLEKVMENKEYAQANLAEIRRHLRQYESDFPDSPLIKPLGKNLRAQATKLFDRAKAREEEAKEAKDKSERNRKRSEAIAILKQAEEIWPDLPGLQSFRGQLERGHQRLRVAMRSTPKYFSPAKAVTEPELRAVDLLFESLVVLAPDRDGMLYYRSGLAEGRPQVVPRGREFRLPRHARWSDGQEMTAGDVSFSVEELKKGRSTGRARDWGELLEKVRVGGDAFKVKLQMKQGFIDPLALASFKIVPDRTTPHPNTTEFAEKPIGSGPFVLVDTRSENGRIRTLFESSPHYGSRTERAGLPHFAEVRFVRSDEPEKDLRAGLVDLAVDLTAKEAASLKEGGFEVPLPDEKSINRRIYFLAINNGKTSLSDPDLRLALALAIDREALLDKHFREGLGRTVHWAINGPYPVQSWARNPKLVSRKDPKSLDPYDPALARAKAKQALTRLKTKEVRLTLKYPGGDKALAAAMAELCERVNKALPGVVLDAMERDPHALHEDVETSQKYELAYWWYDFPDETFWLMPLLGPGGKNDDNYLAYKGRLVGKVQESTNLRHFADVRKQAHAIHQLHLEGEMPFIPLWQLTPLYAYQKGKIDVVPFEAYRMFAQIERWQVK